MKFKCNFCSSKFVQNISLKKHLSEKRCKSLLLYEDNYVKFNEIINDKDKIIEKQRIELLESQREIEMLKVQFKSGNINNVHGNNNNVSNINMKIEFNINPITKLDIKHIEHNKLREIIEKYDDEKEIVSAVDKFNNDKVNILLSGYIKDMICDSEHPINHAVKYIKKHPPTYNTHVEDQSGNTVTVIMGLKDTCELLTDPILDQLKIKLKEFIIKYKGDTEPEFDYKLYENAILELRKELNKQNVKRALKSVLKNDILNNIEMKLTLEKI